MCRYYDIELSQTDLDRFSYSIKVDFASKILVFDNGIFIIIDKIQHMSPRTPEKIFQRILSLALYSGFFCVQKYGIIDQLIGIFNVAFFQRITGILKYLFLQHTGCPKQNAPFLKCHIVKNIEFDVFKFSTVIQYGLKQCTESVYVIISSHSNYSSIQKLVNFQPWNKYQKLRAKKF